jgi:predicted Zn-dependent peptidase
MDTMLKPQLSSLSNGLKLLKIPLNAESVTCMVLVNTGSRFESKNVFGIAHFLEHMVFKGTKKYKKANQLASVVDGVGANFNAFTSKEYTGFYVKTAAEHLGLSLEVVSDLVLRPLLRKEDLEKEKGVIIEELNMYKDMPARYIGDLFEEMFFKDAGLSHNIIGNIQSIKSLRQQDFKQFMSSWYQPNNMTLVLAGNSKAIESSKIKKQVKDLFFSSKTRVSNKSLSIDSYLSKNPVSDKRVSITTKKTEQAHFVLGWPGLNRTSKDKYVLALLSIIMGGNMSSRLFNEVRDKRGLCYYVHSQADFYHDTGIFSASAGVDLSRVDEAIRVVLEEFLALASGKKKVGAKELQKAKDYLIGKMILGFEDSESVAQYFGLRQLLLGRVGEFNEIKEKINQVSLSEIQKLAKQLISRKKTRLAIIGPFDKLDNIAEYLDID